MYLKRGDFCPAHQLQKEPYSFQSVEVRMALNPQELKGLVDSTPDVAVLLNLARYYVQRRLPEQGVDSEVVYDCRRNPGQRRMEAGAGGRRPRLPARHRPRHPGAGGKPSVHLDLHAAPAAGDGHQLGQVTEKQPPAAARDCVCWKFTAGML